MYSTANYYVIIVRNDRGPVARWLPSSVDRASCERTSNAGEAAEPQARFLNEPSKLEVLLLAGSTEP